jgi:hypothetical protein
LIPRDRQKGEIADPVRATSTHKPLFQQKLNIRSKSSAMRPFCRDDFARTPRSDIAIHKNKIDV